MLQIFRKRPLRVLVWGHPGDRVMVEEWYRPVIVNIVFVPPDWDGRDLNLDETDHLFVVDRPAPPELIRLLDLTQGKPVWLVLLPGAFGHGIRRLGRELKLIKGRLILRRRGWSLGLQRLLSALFNRLAAAGALLFLSPLLMMIAGWIRLDSRGPVIFRQERAGKDGRRYTMFKFRTMAQSTDQAVHRELSHAYIRGIQLTPDNVANKPKERTEVTRAGRWLRETSIDELPQLLNVLVGNMSLVGPRPGPFYDLEAYLPWHWHRLQSLPGITGVWQVHARADVMFQDMVLLDIYYIQAWSFWWDVKLILQTIPTMVRGKGAH